ncbi:aminomethyl transferase family protein [Microbacterium sp. LMI12-1-1.1]
MRRPLLMEFDQAWGAPQYTDWIDESLSWKQTCYLGDWSWLPDLKFTGPDSLRLFADVSVNTMDRFAVNQSKHIIHTNPDGKVVGEGILSRIGQDEFVEFGPSCLWTDFIRRQGNYDVQAEPVGWTKLQLQGPTALHVLERASGQEVRDIGFMRSTVVTIAGNEVRVLRQGMTGEIGFELQASRSHLGAISDAIMSAGEEFGIRRMGAKVSMINHLEAGIPTVTLDYLPAFFDEWSSEYYAFADATLSPLFGGPIMDQNYRVAGSFHSDDIRDYYRSPVELGWGNRINFDHNFIGMDALREELAAPRRVLRTLVWNSDDVLSVWGEFFKRGESLPDWMEIPRERRGYMWADQVQQDGRTVAVSTSRGYSAHFRQMLSLAVVDVEASEIGQSLTLLYGNPGTPQREIRVTVAAAPYKDDHARVDLSALPRTAGLVG